MSISRESFLQQSFYYKPAQKQVTNLLVKIEGQPHQTKDYRQLLEQKQDFQKNNEIINGGFQKINQVLDPKQSRSSYPQSTQNEPFEVGGMCPVCFQQIRGRGLNCNICRKTVCRNCITRNRLMKNGFIQKFCDKCDQAFLQAMINKDFLKEFALYQKAFQTLVSQQQSLQILLNSEKVKVKKEQISVQNKKILQNDELIQQLKHEKEANNERVQEIQNKIDWGESMTKSLRLKYRKLKKLLKQSFGSSHSDTAYVEWEPPQAEDQIALDEDNINQSFITTNFDKTPDLEEVEGVHDKEMCKCQLI